VSVVRLGTYISAGAVIVPRLLHTLRDERPDIRVITREGTTPALVRALRAGTLDLAVISSRPPYRPPDDELPALVTEIPGETVLLVAASAEPMQYVTVTLMACRAGCGQERGLASQAGGFGPWRRLA
jgi:DNA-binding transcriptional LysR family regulator